MNVEKRNNRLQLLNEHVDLYFLLRNFGVQIIPLQIITFFSEESPYTHVSVIKHGSRRVSKSPLVLVFHLVSRRGGVKSINKALGEMQLNEYKSGLLPALSWKWLQISQITAPKVVWFRSTSFMCIEVCARSEVSARKSRTKTARSKPIVMSYARIWIMRMCL